MQEYKQQCENGEGAKDEAERAPEIFNYGFLFN